MYGMPLGTRFNDANVERWNATQIRKCLTCLDGMLLRQTEIENHIEHYREHARYAIGDAIARKKSKRK